MTKDQIQYRLDELQNCVEYTQSQLIFDIQILNDTETGAQLYEFNKDTIEIRQKLLFKYIENIHYLEKLMLDSTSGI